MGDIFNIEFGRVLRDRGMSLAASNRKEWLTIAQDFAEELGREQLFVTADDVCEAMAREGLYDLYQSLGNARGSLFKRKCWLWTGEFKPSERPIVHTRPVRIWMYYPNE